MSPSLGVGFVLLVLQCRDSGGSGLPPVVAEETLVDLVDRAAAILPTTDEVTGPRPGTLFIPPGAAATKPRAARRVFEIARSPSGWTWISIRGVPRSGARR